MMMSPLEAGQGPPLGRRVIELQGGPSCSFYHCKLHIAHLSTDQCVVVVLVDTDEGSVTTHGEAH